MTPEQGIAKREALIAMANQSGHIYVDGVYQGNAAQKWREVEMIARNEHDSAILRGDHAAALEWTKRAVAAAEKAARQR